MDNLGFDFGSILTPEEADKLFDENEPVDETQAQNEEQETETEIEPAEEEDTSHPSESVGGEDETSEDAVTDESDGSSPNVYSSIASALKNDGIFPDFEDSELEAVKTPEDFANLFERAITDRLDERQKRIDAALGYGVQPDTIKMYEQTLQYLGSINEEVLSAEGEEGDNLRRQLIYNDLVNRGFSPEKANKEIEKSFKSGTDVDDAKDALEALNKYYTTGYNRLQQDAKRRVEEQREEQQRQANAFRKSILEDEVKIGDTVLNKRTCQRVYEAVTKPVYKDPETGQLLTAIQKFYKDNPMEFQKQVGMWYVLTDGGKNIDGIAKEQVRKEKNKSIRELGQKINTTALNRDGSLRYSSRSTEDSDPLLSDGWKVGWDNN